MEIVRLGQGVDRTGRLAPEALERTFAVPREYAEQCRELGVERVRFVATSASRDAENAGEFVAGVREAFGASASSPRSSPATRRRALSFTGATGDLQRGGVPGPYLVVDIGGGSTEFVRGTDRRRGGALGRRRLRADDRAAPARRPADARRDRGGRGATSSAALDAAEETVALTGTAPSSGWPARSRRSRRTRCGCRPTTPTPSTWRAVPVDVMPRGCESTCSPMTHAERAALPYMHPGRVDVIGAGALVWDAGASTGRCGARRVAVVVTSEHDILDGIALSLT